MLYTGSQSANADEFIEYIKVVQQDTFKRLRASTTKYKVMADLHMNEQIL